MGNRSVFFPDDFDRINGKYFHGLRAHNEVAADPSFWYENHSEAAFRFGFDDIKTYTSDYSGRLAYEKTVILEAFRAWDNAEYNADNLSLCSSATVCSLAILAYLRTNAKIEHVAFETPSYFASVKQAEYVGLTIHLLPTYFDDEFYAAPELFLNVPSPKAIWLTQPRFGLG